MAVGGTRMAAPDRRAVIIDAARTEFALKGYAGTRIRSIAERAGVNDAMLYRHFESKEQLFEAAVAEPIEAAVASIIERPMPPLPADAGTEEMRERSVAFYRDLLAALEAVGPLLGIVLFGDQQRGIEYYRERLEPLLDRVVELTADLSGRWRHTEFDAHLLHRMIFGTCWMIAIDGHYGRRDAAPLDETARQLVDILFDGIAK
jgi:AcrR family transcriptional regulator